MSTKKRRPEELYEDYWKLTVGHTDFFKRGSTSFKVLQKLVDRINSNKPPLERGEIEYHKLQEEVLEVSPKSAPSRESKLQSTRKEINQFVKLGFIEPWLAKKHKLTEEFIAAATINRKIKIFSKIFESNAKFQCSATIDEDKRNHMKFLLTTLEEIKEINLKEDIQGLMMCKIEKIHKGYLTREELDEYNNEAEKINFKERKYNQVGYLKNFCNKMIDLRIVGNNLLFKNDADDIFGPLDPEVRKRNPYKQRLWVNELKDEANHKCMVDRIIKKCIGSHIKSWKQCIKEGNEEQAWDINNGLYLNRNVDVIFNDGLISFADNGNILIGDKIGFDEKEKIKNQKIHQDFISPERCKYLAIHRKNHGFN